MEFKIAKASQPQPTRNPNPSNTVNKAPQLRVMRIVCSRVPGHCDQAQVNMG